LLFKPAVVANVASAPKPEEAARLINSGKRRGVVVVVGICEV